jgi:hypothetical protein
MADEAIEITVMSAWSCCRCHDLHLVSIGLGPERPQPVLRPKVVVPGTYGGRGAWMPGKGLVDVAEIPELRAGQLR